MPREVKTLAAAFLAGLVLIWTVSYCASRDGRRSDEDEQRKTEQARIDSAIDRSVQRAMASVKKSDTSILVSDRSSGSFRQQAAKPVTKIVVDSASLVELRAAYLSLQSQYYALLESGTQAVDDCDTAKKDCQEAKASLQVVIDSLNDGIKIRDQRIANPPPSSPWSVGVTAGYSACLVDQELKLGPGATVGGSYRFFGGRRR